MVNHRLRAHPLMTEPEPGSFNNCFKLKGETSMQPNKQDEARKVRVSVHLTTFIVLVMVALALGACTRNGAEQNQNGNAPRSVVEPSPSPSPSPSGSPDFVPADTIIVIRDGSVNIKVNKNKLCGDDDTPTEPDKKYKCDRIQLGSAELQTKSGPIPTPALTPNSRITINGDTPQEIEVKGNPSHVTIKFKKAHYPQCGQPGEHCGTHHVGVIKIDSFTKTCTAAEECKLTIRKKL